LRVGMQHDCDRRVLFLLGVIAAFQATFGTWKNYLGHMRKLLRQSAVAILDELAEAL
jgi:hypothetical protein